MSSTIEQIEEQIANLQQTLEELKNQKLRVSRYFSGEYFNPYQGRLYRRMESDGVPIWESYLDVKEQWVMLPSKETLELEKIYQEECVITGSSTAGGSVHIPTGAGVIDW
jgi:hypothetical protein